MSCKNEEGASNRYAPLIKQNFMLLTRALDPSEELLCNLNVLWSEDQLPQFKSNCTPDMKSADLWSTLLKWKTEDVDNFLNILRSYDQHHVANILHKTNEKVPMSEEHVKSLDRNCSLLCKFIDPKGGLTETLMSNEAFRASDVDRVDTREIYDDMAREIIQILRRKSDCTYEKFIAALNATGQSHVIFILTNGREGDPPVCSDDIDHLNRKLDIVTARLEPVASGLLERLVAMNIFTDRDQYRVRAARGEKAQSALLLLLMKRKSQKSFNKLKEALELSNMKHIAVEIFGSPVNGCIIPKTNKELSDMDADKLQDDLRNKLKLDADWKRGFRKDGLIAHVDEGSIKLRFECQSSHSLNVLYQLYLAKELDRILTERYVPEFSHRGLESLTVEISLEEFERCRRDFIEEALMSEEHYQALNASIDLVAHKLLVNEELLKRIELCKNRLKAITDEKTDSDRAKRVLAIVSRLPDRAFVRFIEALWQTNQMDVANIIAKAAVCSPTEAECKEFDSDRQNSTPYPSAGFFKSGVAIQINEKEMLNFMEMNENQDMNARSHVIQDQAFMSFEAFFSAIR